VVAKLKERPLPPIGSPEDVLIRVMLLHGSTKANRERPPKGVKFPSHIPLELALARHFRLQRRFVLGQLDTLGQRWLAGVKAERIAVDWDDDTDDAALVRRVFPILSALWDDAGEKATKKTNKVRVKAGLDPRIWDVKDPNVRGKIETAALDLAQSTRETTEMEFGVAVEMLRRELAEGIVDRGESVAKLTKRVKSIFTNAETDRASRIAQTETIRAVHAGQVKSDEESGVVVGYRWLTSTSPCSVCSDLGGMKPVRMGGKFATVGTHRTYSHIYHPPAHPRCVCSLVAVLDPELTGEPEPEWATAPLDQPGQRKPKPEAVEPTPTPTPARKPRKPKGPTAAERLATWDALNRAIEGRGAYTAISELVEAAAGGPGPVQVHGMPEPEQLRSVNVAGHTFRAADFGPESRAVQDIATLLGWRNSLPPRLAESTREIVYSAARNKDDPYWARVYGKPDVKSNGTGSDGTVVLYNVAGRRTFNDPSTIIHEMGHNLASAAYGSTTPPIASAFDRARSAEPTPPTEYGGVNPAEDFAESVRLYVATPKVFRASHPRRAAALDELFKVE
jgi:hypothetical protein